MKKLFQNEASSKEMVQAIKVGPTVYLGCTSKMLQRIMSKRFASAISPFLENQKAKREVSDDKIFKITNTVLLTYEHPYQGSKGNGKYTKREIGLKQLEFFDHFGFFLKSVGLTLYNDFFQNAPWQLNILFAPTQGQNLK